MPERNKAPFRVSRGPISGQWLLAMRVPYRDIAWFPTQGEAIDHAYRNWPWWL